MKSICSHLFILVLLAIASQSSAQDLKLVIERGAVKDSRVFQGWGGRDSCGLLAVNAHLINTSADTVHFLNMSCSTVEAFDTSPLVAFSGFHFNCDKNILDVIRIAPGQSYSCNFLLRTIAVVFKVKLGFYWVHDQGPHWPDFSRWQIEQKQLRKAGKAIWSNEITF